MVTSYVNLMFFGIIMHMHFIGNTTFTLPSKERSESVFVMSSTSLESVQSDHTKVCYFCNYSFLNLYMDVV